jgi:hypothetical protein
LSKQHSVTVRVELEDGTIIQQVVGFNGGNPLFHVKETGKAGIDALEMVGQALEAIYGAVENPLWK